jgi:hypothetical protein
MRLLLIAFACLVPACHSQPSSVPGDGGGIVDLAASGGTGGGGIGGSGGGSGRPCVILCIHGLSCCDGQCVNLMNDIHNCGQCGVVCNGAQPYCANGCAVAPCEPPCGGGQLCCDVRGPGPQPGPTCTTPTPSGTCPPGQPSL